MTMEGRAGPSGMTLLEVVLALVVVAITVPVTLSFMGSVARNSARAQLTSRAALLGHALMEEILSKRFDEMLEQSGGNWSSPLGQDAQDNSTWPSTFYDDVDDYNGFSETLSTAYGSFTRSVQVEYIFPGTTTNYKRITVTVSEPAGVSIQLVGLATTANSQGVPQQS